MKIYVSDKEKDYYIAYGNGYEALELNKREPINIISLEQHEQEIRKPLEDKIKELIKSKNEQENILLDKIIKLQKQLKQERQRVIAELEEWLETAEKRTTEKALELATEKANDWFRGSEAGKSPFLKDYSVNEFLEQARNLYGDK